MSAKHRPPGFRGVLRDDADARAVYAEAAGIARVIPRAIAQPADVDDLSRLVAWAAETGIPLVPRGSGSSMAGGAVGDGIIVDLSRWRALEPVDDLRRSVRAEPGALRDDVDAAAAKRGLRLPVDPSSGAFCTVGGMAATNASGPHTLAFGSMRRWVRALDCVFADGTRAEIRRGAPPPAVPAIERFVRDAAPALRGSGVRSSEHAVRKESSGYAVHVFSTSGEVIDLLVGSEGTLALFAQVEIELAPAAGATSSILGAFVDLDAAATAAIVARDAGAAACELLDRTFLDLARSTAATLGIPRESEAVLLAEVEGATPANAADRAGAVERAFLDHGATMSRTALEPATATELWALRHAASPTLARLDPSLRSMQFIEDGAVPPEQLSAYIRGIRTILDRHDTRGVIFGHAGDAHVHVNPLVDVARADWRERVVAMFAETVSLTAALGGTLSGEHGDGRLRTPALDRVWSNEALTAFRLVKEAFDPAGILNPGVKIALRRQSPIGAVKYDPSLAALPPLARAALDAVDRDRAYARSRLDMLGASA